jgi:hypothetical protein
MEELHEDISYALHGRTVLFIGIMAFTQHIKDNQGGVTCLKDRREPLLIFQQQEVHP